MGTWNYRIVRYANGTGYGLHEVYYGDGQPNGMTVEPSYFVDDTPDGLIADMEVALRDARERPVLDEPPEWAGPDDFGSQESQPESGRVVAVVDKLKDYTAAVHIGSAYVGCVIRLDGGVWGYDTGVGALAAREMRAIADALDELNNEPAPEEGPCK